MTDKTPTQVFIPIVNLNKVMSWLLKQAYLENIIDYIGYDITVNDLDNDTWSWFHGSGLINFKSAKLSIVGKKIVESCNGDIIRLFGLLYIYCYLEDVLKENPELFDKIILEFDEGNYDVLNLIKDLI